MAERTRIDHLRLTAPDEGSGQRLARDTAQALRSALAQSGLSGRVDRVRVTIDPAQARDPAAIARAVAQAIREDGT